MPLVRLFYSLYHTGIQSESRHPIPPVPLFDPLALFSPQPALYPCVRIRYNEGVHCTFSVMFCEAGGRAMREKYWNDRLHRRIRQRLAASAGEDERRRTAQREEKLSHYRSIFLLLDEEGKADFRRWLSEHEKELSPAELRDLFTGLGPDPNG